MSGGEGEDDDRARGSGCGWIELALLVAVLLIVGGIAIPNYVRQRRNSNAVAGIRNLKSITTAQSIFREGDKEEDGNLDYGMLSELGNTKLVDSELGAGTKDGYFFQATYSYETSEFLWFAISSPQDTDEQGDRYFCTNEAGVIFYTTGGAFQMDTSTCGDWRGGRIQQGIPISGDGKK